jgi:hypothetical protein
MIPVDSGWIWTWDKFHWKGYLCTLPWSYECPNWMPYTTWASVWMWTAPGRVELWILNLFRQLWSNPILVRLGPGSIENFILSYFRVYVKCPNPISYASYTSISSWGGLWLWVGLEVKLWNSELYWISTLMCTSPCLSVIPRSEIAGTKPPYVCPGCSNHT